ncbi:hypothetical protein [Streptomyces sp. 900105245]
MTNIIERYTWEDSLIEAETQGIISAGAVNMCLRLAKAINWKPGNKRKGQPSGLYWKNEEALKAVNSSRATYFRYRKSLFEAGFFTEVNGNLIPQIPVLSQTDTDQSHIETKESQIETEESQTDTPYSEDTYSEDVSSDKNNAAVPAAGKEADNKDETKEDEETKTVDSPLSSVVTDSPLPSEKKTRPVKSLFVEKRAALVEARATEADEIEVILSSSEHEAKARKKFNDPNHRPGMVGALRARWCVTDSIPEPVAVKKTGIDSEEW